MKVEQLAKLCVDSLWFANETGLPAAEAGITLTFPKGWKTPPKFPKGKLLQVKEDGVRIKSFSAVNILAWLAANKLVKVEFDKT